MNKTVNVLLSSFVVFSLVACGGGKESEMGGPLPPSSKTYEIVEAKAPEGGYCIYLDASGSVPGYFKDGLADYIKIVSGLEGGNDRSKVYFWGEDNREITNLNSTITDSSYNGKASLFQDIFKVMANKAKADKSLTFLVTDGIVSNAHPVTQKRTGYTIADLPLLPAKIKKALGDSMAVAIFRCEIPFNGIYYNIDNKKINIKGNRPIFVFAIGYPDAVADLRNSVMSKKKEMENFTSMKKLEQLYMGIYKEVKNKHPFRDTEGNRFSTDTANVVSLEAGVTDFEIAVDIPQWIADMGADPKKNGVITIVSTNDGSSIDVDKYYDDGVMKFQTKEDTVFNLGNYSVNYCINYQASAVWDKYNCSDDRAIASESDTLYDKTFGLKEILRGFELATQQPDTLFKTSFDFQVNQ